MANYLVIGGSSGIGLEVVNALLEDDNDVFVASRTKSDDWSDSEKLHFTEFDVKSDDDLSIEVDRLDGLVYCPGTINLKPFHRFKIEDFREDMEINLLGAVKIIQSSLDKLKKSDSASVVMFSTVAVQEGMSFHSSIAAAKGAVEGLTKSLAAELAPKIRVNAIAPSVTDTPLAERLLSNDSKRESAEKRHPISRVGTTKDMKEAVLFLLSNKSSWITGHILPVDGGLGTISKL